MSSPHTNSGNSYSGRGAQWATAEEQRQIWRFLNNLNSPDGSVTITKGSGGISFQVPSAPKLLLWEYQESNSRWKIWVNPDFAPWGGDSVATLYINDTQTADFEVVSFFRGFNGVPQFSLFCNAANAQTGYFLDYSTATTLRAPLYRSCGWFSVSGTSLIYKITQSPYIDIWGNHVLYNSLFSFVVNGNSLTVYNYNQSMAYSILPASGTSITDSDSAIDLVQFSVSGNGSIYYKPKGPKPLFSNSGGDDKIKIFDYYVTATNKIVGLRPYGIVTIPAYSALNDSNHSNGLTLT